MRELTKSAIGYAWAMSLFGAEQFANAFSPRGSERAGEAFYTVTRAATDELGDILWAAYQVGDQLQRSSVNLLFDFATLRAFNPTYASRLAEEFARQLAETLRSLAPGESLSLAYQEFRNNYEVYNLVKHVHDRLHIPSGGDFPLAELLERAYALGAYPDLWAVEGLGHDYAASLMDRGAPVRDILTDERASVLPAKSLTMMHAGIGLAFAERLMKRVTPYSSREHARGVLAEFLALCRENSRHGYVGAAYESLGLVTRTWHAQTVALVDSVLCEIAPEAVGYFWHGAGRALYFLPIYFVPGLLSPWAAAEREPPREEARLNMKAGLAWATTLVNIRQPRIMENLLRRDGATLARDAGFTNGLMSSLIMGYDVTPGDEFIEAFCAFRSDARDAASAERWERMVASPCREALQDVYPALREHERLGEVFHYQDLPALAVRLRQTRAAVPR
jgi:hypothetical protein